MWLYFNSRGQLVKALTHGPVPVAGTTNFGIFAVFEGIDSLTNAYEVSIKLRKPDLSGSEYPILLMNSESKEFVLDTEHGETAEDVLPFRVADSPYHGFYFDFADFNDSQDTEVLLDTPGLWEAIITIFGSDRSVFVQGVATFNVGNGIVNEDGSSINVDVLLDQIIAALATKIGVGQPTIVHDVDNYGLIKVGLNVDGQDSDILIQADNTGKIKIVGDVSIIGSLIGYINEEDIVALIAELQTKIEDGTVVANKATYAEGDLMPIVSTYGSALTLSYNDTLDRITVQLYSSNNTLLDTKYISLPLAGSKNGLMSATDKTKLDDLPNKTQYDLDRDEKVDKTTTILGIPLDNSVLLGEFKTALGEATQSLSGLMSATDKSRLDALHVLLGTEADADNVVNTINEILAIFNNYPEGVDIVTALNGKVDKVVGMQLTHNDYSDTEKDKVSQAYTHKSLTNNPHATTFAQLGSKPTTIAGFGITDAYTKAYIDSLKDLNGWESELITSTPLTNGQTIALTILQGFDCIKLFARNTATGEIDTDSFDTSLGLVSGYKYQLFDNANIVLTIGSPNCAFTDTVGGYELSIIGQKYTELKAEDVSYGETSDVKTELDKLTIPAYQEVTHEALQSEITATNDVEIKDDSGHLIRIEGNGPTQVIVSNNEFADTTGWTGENTTLTASAGVLTLAPNGTSQYAGAYQNITWAAGRKIYNRIKLRATTANVYTLSAMVWTNVNNYIMQPYYIVGPAQNQWYTLSGVYTPTDNGTIFKITCSRKSTITDAQFASERVQVDYVKTYDVSDMISKGVKNDEGVLFSALTDEEICLQLDIWEEQGYPTHINKLISKNDNLFNGTFKTISSLASEILNDNFDMMVPRASPNQDIPFGFTSTTLTNRSLVNGIFTGTGTNPNDAIYANNMVSVLGEIYYSFARVKSNSNKVRLVDGKPYASQYHTGSDNWELLSFITPPKTNTNHTLGIDLGSAVTGGATFSVDYMGTINITDLVSRGILPLGLTNAQYKEMLDNAIFTNVPLRESDYIAVEPLQSYKIIKVSNNSVNHKVIEYSMDNQVVKVNSVDYSGNIKISTPITMNALTRKVKLVSDLMDRPNQQVVNPLFTSTSNWTTWHGTASVANSICTVLGNTADTVVSLYQDIATIIGHSYYVSGEAMTPNSDITVIRLSVDNNYQILKSTPSANTWYKYSFIHTATVTNGITQFGLWHATSINGKTLNARNPMRYDITEFKDKGVKNDTGTLFSVLTNSEIKAQMDLWVVNGFPDHVINALYPNGADSAISVKYNDADNIYSEQQIDEVPLDLTLRSGEYWENGVIIHQNGNAQAYPLSSKIFSAWNYGQLDAIYTSGFPMDFKIKYAQNTSAQVSTNSEYLKEARERIDTLRTNQEQLIDKLGLIDEDYDSYAGITSAEYEYFGLEGIKEGNTLAIEGYGQSIQNLLGKSGTITASQTVRGITITYDSATGIFTANGTATAGVAFNITLASGMNFALPTGTSIQLMRYYDSVDGGTANLNGSYVGYVLMGTSVSNRINENSEALYDPYINGSGALTANHATNKQQLIFQVWKEGIVFTNFKFKVGIYQGLQLRPFILPSEEPAKSSVSVYNKTANKLNLSSALSITDSGVTITYDPLIQEFLLSGTATATKDISLTATFSALSGDRFSIKRSYQSGDITSAGGVLPRIKLIDGVTVVVYNDIYKMTAPEGQTPTPDVSFNTGTASADGILTLKLGITTGQIFDSYRFRLMIHDKSSDIGYVKYEKNSVGSMILTADEKAVLNFTAIPFGILEFIASSNSLNLVFGDSVSDLRYSVLEYNAGIGSPNRKISVLDERITAIDEPFRGKVIAIWGDSRESNNPTFDPNGVGDQKDTSYPALLAKKLHATVLNYGLSGGAWAENTVQQDAASAIVNRVLTEDVNASADVIIISSMNDFKLATPLGSSATSNKDKTTFYGAMRLTYDRLATKYPGKKIWLVLPQKRYDESTNYGGGDYLSYRRAQLDVAREYGIPTIDLYNNFPNAKPTFFATNMLNDTHFSAVGNDLVAELITRSLIGNGNNGVVEILPPLPTTNGSYTIKLTVLNGVNTFEWILI